MRRMRLDDLQIERYSRQIILPELGAEGQVRLAGARVAVAGEARNDAAGHLVAHLAAAGVGTIASPRALHAWADPGQEDVTLVELADAAAAGSFDVAVQLGETPATLPRASHVLWLADERLGELPPCAACVRSSVPPGAPVPAVLAGAHAAVLGALAATETIKRVIGAGTPLAGRVLAYDAAHATVTVETVAARPDCPVCAHRIAAEG
jgi:adenylyltransferase/sulfurtransferase